MIGIALLLSIVLISGCADKIGETAQKECQNGKGQWVVNEQFPNGHCNYPDSDSSGIPTPQASGTESDADIPNVPI